MINITHLLNNQTTTIIILLVHFKDYFISIYFIQPFAKSISTGFL